MFILANSSHATIKNLINKDSIKHTPNILSRKQAEMGTADHLKHKVHKSEYNENKSSVGISCKQSCFSSELITWIYTLFKMVEKFLVFSMPLKMQSPLLVLFPSNLTQNWWTLLFLCEHKRKLLRLRGYSHTFLSSSGTWSIFVQDLEFIKGF